MARGRPWLAPAVTRGRRGAGETGAARILVEPRLEPWLEAGLRLRRCYAGAETGKDLHPAGRLVVEFLNPGNSLRVHGGWNPERRGGANLDAMEIRCGHTD